MAPQEIENASTKKNVAFVGDSTMKKNTSVQTIIVDHSSKQKTDGSCTSSLLATNNLLVPYPLPNTVNLRVGSDIVLVNGDHTEELQKMKSGDFVRFCDAHESLNWTILELLPLSCTDSTSPAAPGGVTMIRLTMPYDHSRIETIEKKRLDNAVHRLCYPHNKKEIYVRKNNYTSQSSSSCTDEKHSCSNQEEHVRHVASDAEESIHSPLHINNTRIWKLIPEDEDCRPMWRKEFDSAQVPWTNDHVGSKKFVVHFRVKISLEQIEKNCIDFPFDLRQCNHQQRVYFFEAVPLSIVINEAFQAVCRWHPKSNLVDNVKWAKLSRQMKFLSNVKNAKHEIDMAFVRHNQDRKLNIDRFRAIFESIASIEYPALPTEEALSKVVWSSIVMLPDVNNMIWIEAKKMAMDVEARRVCAQLRISAQIRMHISRVNYLKQKVAAVAIEKYARRFLACGFVSKLLYSIRESDMYKQQFKCATVIQTAWRQFFWRVRFVLHQECLAKSQRECIAKTRSSLQELRERERAKIILQSILRLEFTIAIVHISFTDECDLQNENSMKLKIYVPTTKETFVIHLKENSIRKCLENAQSSDGQLSWNEMLDISVLNKLLEHLMLRVVRGRPIFLFCKRNIAEKGNLIDQRIVSAIGDYFVLSIFHSPSEFIFVAYQCSKCLQVQTKLSITKLQEWLYESKQKQLYINEMMIDQTYSNSPELIQWLVKHIVIRTNSESGVLQLCFQFEIEEEKIARLVTKIQAQWRRFVALKCVRRIAIGQYEKIFVREISSFAYRNIVTNERKWVKPKLLGNADISDPVDKWRVQMILDHSTGEKVQYYENFATGQTSWLSEMEAACIIQRRYRSKLESDIFGTKLEFSDVVKAVRFIHGARKNYSHEPQKLSNMVNYALVLHCLDLDFVRAKTLYENALKQSPNHPLITRAYGILLLASKVLPHATTFQHACRLFHEADAVDPTRARFQPAADIYFKWAAIANVRSPLALLNYALLHQCIYKSYDRTEMIYRAALVLDPTNPLVVENYCLFTEELYPGGVYASLGPPKSVIRRSHVVEERPEWAEWCRMQDPECPKIGMDVFWFNRFTKETRFMQPLQSSIWEQRVARSSCLSRQTLSWIEYWDKRTKTSFFYNANTKQYACVGGNSASH